MINKIRLIDNSIIKNITRMHNPTLNRIMVTATYLGCGAFIWWIVLCLPFVISEKHRETGIILVIALGINYVSGEHIIKPLVRRSRPSDFLNEEELIVKRPKDYSFVSGHTSSSFTAATVTMLRCAPMIWVPVLIGACIISFSRMYLRVHYLSDVIGGALLGIISGTLCVLVTELCIAPGV